jgi:signal peptidase I
VFNQIIELLSWVLIPVAIITLVDDWFFRPQRRIAALPAETGDPSLLKLCYTVLPFLVIAGLIHLLRAERLDFALALVSVSAVGGAIWAFDAWVLRPRRERLALAAGKDPAAVIEPGVVDYARSMVPVFVVVLLLRSFLFEPFRIPSDSMMPTLQDGDFILVNKFSYGLRLPVVNRKILSVGEPERGDVVVFRYPPDPAINYIKRLVGLPGDRVKVIDDIVYVNDTPLETRAVSRYSDGCYSNMQLSAVQTGEHQHQTLSCKSPFQIVGPPVPSCNRKIDRSYQCAEEENSSPLAQQPDDNDYPETLVPAGNYLMIGDNRDNSADGRVWGFVPEANLVGSARRIWFNFDLGRTGLISWDRIWHRIE